MTNTPMTGESVPILEASLKSWHDHHPHPILGTDSLGMSERCVEVPWVAARLGTPDSLLDVGWAMSPPEWFGVLFAAADAGTRLTGIDIIDPQRVRSRYAQEQVERVLSVDIRVEDVLSAEQVDGVFEAITCVSTLEHIGFDMASDSSNTESVFDRGRTPEEAVRERDPETDRTFMDASHRLLAPGGQLLVSVPAGFGVPILHQDSLGFFTYQFEYDQASWRNVVDHSGFELEDSAFYRYDDSSGWAQVERFDDLTDQTSAMRPYATGCAMASLRKV